MIMMLHTKVPEMLESLNHFAKLLHPQHDDMRDNDPLFQIGYILITIGNLRKANEILIKVGVKP